MRSIKSMYWKNINPEIVVQQKRVLQSLGYGIIQDEADRVPHGQWLTQQLEHAQDHETLLFLDIDAFPLHSAIVERAFAAAEQGRVFGVAQTANHVPNRYFIYAAPSFLAAKRKTWIAAGKPNLMPDENHDAGMALSVAAAANNIPIEVLLPSFVATPRWPLADQGVFGTATFYENAVFHLFESRTERGNREALDHVADCIIRQRTVDFIWLHKALNSNDIKRIRKNARYQQLLRRIWRKHILRKSPV